MPSILKKTKKKKAEKGGKHTKLESPFLTLYKASRIMAPSKKGGKKESKTGAAVRVLDDDEEDKIQVLLLLSLRVVFLLFRQSESD